MKERERESSELAESKIENKIFIDFNNFKKFKIDSFFDVFRGKRIVKEIDYSSKKNNKNIYPVITATTQKNGIDGYYKNFNSQGSVIISCGEVSGMYSTFHDKKIWVLDTMRILKPKYNFLNKYVAFFLIPLLNANMIKFSYGLKAKPKDIKKINIKLPVDKYGNPDWKFMEDYIKSLPYSKYL